MSDLMTLTCECCGHIAQLTAEDAFALGWDAPPHFTQVVVCPLCLSAPLVLGEGTAKHQRAHERWAREGRPSSFDESKAAGDLDEYNLPEREEMVETLTALFEAVGIDPKEVFPGPTEE